jgi:GT2 family glycosyltransferase
MKLSVVIATYNRLPVLSRTLPTVLDQDFPPEQREIVVVIDGSTDATAQYLRTVRSPCPLIILEQPHRGPAAARNAGIQAANGDLVLLLDDDMLCPRGLISGHVAVHQRAQRALAFGPIFVSPLSQRSIAVDWLNLHGDRNTVGSNASPRSKYRAWATNCSLSRSTLTEVGGYDEGLLTHEDADLGIRLWEAGIRFIIDPQLALHEVYDKSPRQLGPEARRLGRDEVILCRKHPGYRPYSRQAHLRRTWTGSALIWLAGRSPISPHALVAPLQFLAQRLSPVRQFQSLSMQLFRCRMAIEEVRGTLEESGSWRALQQSFGLKLPVLRYDAARFGRGTGAANSWRDLERQVRWLKRLGYAGICASQWRAWVCEGSPVAERPVLLLFDNADAEFGEYGLPILRRYGFGAGILLDHPAPGAETSAGRAAGGLLTANDIRARFEGLEFGLRPSGLIRCGPAALERQILARKQYLEDLLGSQVGFFAYPAGAYDEEMRRCAQPLFDCGFTSEPGVNALGTDLFRLCASHVSPRQTIIELSMRLALGRYPGHYLRAERSGPWPAVRNDPLPF